MDEAWDAILIVVRVVMMNCFREVLGTIKVMISFA